MAKGSWSITRSASPIVPENEYRDALTVQLWQGNPVFIAFGEEAIFGEGICLFAPGDSVKASGALARMSVHATCLDVANGGWQDGDLEIMVTGRLENGAPERTQIFNGTLTEETPPYKVSVLAGTLQYQEGEI